MGADCGAVQFLCQTFLRRHVYDITATYVATYVYEIEEQFHILILFINVFFSSRLHLQVRSVSF